MHGQMQENDPQRNYGLVVIYYCLIVRLLRIILYDQKSQVDDSVWELKDEQDNVASLDELVDPFELLRAVCPDKQPDSEHLHDEEVERVPQNVWEDDLYEV